jgi:hypothetical protein
MMRIILFYSDLNVSGTTNLYKDLNESGTRNIYKILAVQSINILNYINNQNSII